MNDATQASPLPAAPVQYEANTINFLLRQLTRTIDAILNRGRIQVNSINVTGIPSAAGVAPTTLAAGDVWLDTTTNTLKVIP